MTSYANGSEISPSREPICETSYYKLAEGMTQNGDLQLAIAWRLKHDDCQAALYVAKNETKEAKEALKKAESKAKMQRGFLIFAGVLSACLMATAGVLGALR